MNVSNNVAGPGAAPDAEESNTGDGKYYIILRNHFADFISSSLNIFNY